MIFYPDFFPVPFGHARLGESEVIYYDFGSLVIVYLNPERADEAYHILRQSTFEDRPILAMILPRLQPANLPNGVQPLLVLVNVKSGGCQVCASSFKNFIGNCRFLNKNWFLLWFTVV